MRNTKVIGFSVPPEMKKEFEKLAEKEHSTKSEFFRKILDEYRKSLRVNNRKDGNVKRDEANIARCLKSYWDLRAMDDLNTIIIALGLVVREERILIGARKEEDEVVENLNWVFPGGKIESLDFEREMKREIKEETDLDVQVKTLVTARLHPDSGFKSTQIVALYFHCTTEQEQKMSPGGDLKKLKWVRPSKVFKYFTTSTCDEVTKFLMTIDKS